MAHVLHWKERLVASRVDRDLVARLRAELDSCLDRDQPLQYFQERFDELLDAHGALSSSRPKIERKVDKAPAKPNERSGMWTAMRITLRFSAQDIAAASDCPVPSVRAYINALIQAGYVRVLKKSSFEVGDFTSYQLLRNTGPQAPRLRADGKSILDLNLPEGQQEVPRVRA